MVFSWYATRQPVAVDFKRSVLRFYTELGCNNTTLQNDNSQIQKPRTVINTDIPLLPQHRVTCMQSGTSSIDL